jgi:hypothetical protein
MHWLFFFKLEFCTKNGKVRVDGDSLGIDGTRVDHQSFQRGFAPWFADDNAEASLNIWKFSNSDPASSCLNPTMLCAVRKGISKK